MARQKYQGAPWLYDENTGDIVGLKDPDGSEMFFPENVRFDQTFTKVSYSTLAPASSLATGETRWSADSHTVETALEHGVVMQEGFEVFALVENDTGSDFDNGMFVGFAGVGAGNNLSVAPYLADGATPSLYGLGVMTHALEDSGSVGYCVTWGHVNEVNTTGTPVSETWNVGDILYASPTNAGKFTNVKPTAPDNVIPVAAVLFVGETDGAIFVRPTIGMEQYYGVFTKTTSQSPAATNTAYAMTFDSEEIGNGVTIGTPASRIVVPQSGLYEFKIGLQMTSSSSSQKNIWTWFRKNGVDIAASAKVVTSALNDGYIVETRMLPISMAADDYVEIMFAADSTAVTIGNIAATAFAPAAPGATLQVTQVQL